MEFFIETNRLILRKPNSKDIYGLLKILDDPKVKEFVPSFYLSTYEEVLSLLEILKLADQNDIWLVLEEKTSKKLVGVLSAYRTSENLLPISYAALSSRRGEGFIPEAIKGLVSFLKSHFSCGTVVFAIRRNNISSKNVIKKLHIPFDYTRDHYNYYTLSLSEELPF